MRKRWKWLLILIVMFAIGGFLAFANSRMGIAMLKDRSHFLSTTDTRVQYEPGMKAQAEQVAFYLDEAVSDVERAHGASFRKPVTVYICASWQSFNHFTAAPSSGRARGAMIGQAVFLSHEFGRLGNPRGILVHELSHLHLKQHMGMPFLWRAPEWFKEGLAVMISEAGAERVSEQEALTAILTGEVFPLFPAGRFPNPRRAKDHGLSHFMFYRQSAMFTAFLRDEEPEAFAAMLRDLLSGARFVKAHQKRYGRDLEESWLHFQRSLGNRGDGI